MVYFLEDLSVKFYYFLPQKSLATPLMLYGQTNKQKLIIITMCNVCTKKIMNVSTLSTQIKHQEPL